MPMQRNHLVWIAAALAVAFVFAISEAVLADRGIRSWSDVGARVAPATPATETSTCPEATGVAVGTCEADVTRLLGEPTRRNTDISRRGSESQLVYESGRNVMYVYVRDGRVTRIQRNW